MLIERINNSHRGELPRFALQCCTDFAAKGGHMSRGRKRVHRQRSARATVSIAPDTYQTVQAIAKQKKVSAAWVIRDAVDKYVAEQWPLLHRAS